MYLNSQLVVVTQAGLDGSDIIRFIPFRILLIKRLDIDIPIPQPFMLGDLEYWSSTSENRNRKAIGAHLSCFDYILPSSHIGNETWIHLCLWRADDMDHGEGKIAVDRPVGLDLHRLSQIQQSMDERSNILPHRFASGNDYQIDSFLDLYSKDQVRQRDKLSIFVFGIASRTLQVATCKPDEYRRSPGERTLSLNCGEKLVEFQ